MQISRPATAMHKFQQIRASAEVRRPAARDQKFFSNVIDWVIKKKESRSFSRYEPAKSSRRNDGASNVDMLRVSSCITRLKLIDRNQFLSSLLGGQPFLMN
jgi:hypothetical protein